MDHNRYIINFHIYVTHISCVVVGNDNIMVMTSKLPNLIRDILATMPASERYGALVLVPLLMVTASLVAAVLP